MLLGQSAGVTVLPGATLMDGSIVNLTASQNDFSPDCLKECTSMHLNVQAAGLQITGFAQDRSARLLVLLNSPASLNSVTLVNNSGASLANHVLNLGGGNIVLAPGDMVILYCPVGGPSGTGWNLLAWSKAAGGGGGGGTLGAYVTATVAAGATNNFAPAGFSTSTGRLDIDPNAGASNITGLTAGADGQEVLIANIDAANNLTLNNQNVGSTAANRFRMATDLVLVPGAAVLAVYYAGTVNRWVIKS
jgi:hypothetical protein